MKKIFWCAGEPSGDLHASIVIEELENRGKNYLNFGIGGDLMKKFDFRQRMPFAPFNVMGFWEVIKNIHFFYKAEKQIKQILEKEKPDLVVLVDYPGLNMRLAKIASDLFIPVVYYICPQFWAWKHNRVYKIEKYVNHVAAILPFEKSLLDMHSIDSTYVGHPIASEIKISISKEEFASFYGLDINKKWIGFLPGSRDMEIERMLDIFLKTIKKMDNNDFEFLISKAKSVSHKKFMEKITIANLPNVSIIDGNNYELMKYSDFLVVTSGTASLEAAFLKTPLIIVYKANWLSYKIAQKVVKIKYIGLPNIISEKLIVPELIQENANPENIKKHILNFVEDERKYLDMKNQLSIISETLSSKNTAKSVADIIVNFVES